MKKTDISNSRKRATSLPSPNTATELPSVSVAVEGNPSSIASVASPAISDTLLRPARGEKSSICVGGLGYSAVVSTDEPVLSNTVETPPFSIKRASELEGVA